MNAVALIVIAIVIGVVGFCLSVALWSIYEALMQIFRELRRARGGEMTE